MSDQATYIPFSGIGEIKFNVRRKDWYKFDATECNTDKTIPFIKLLIVQNIIKIKKDWEDTKTTFNQQQAL